MKFLLTIVTMLVSAQAFSNSPCQDFLDKHPIVIFSEFKLAGSLYRYTVSHTRVAKECSLDKYNIALIKSPNAVTVNVYQFINGSFEFITEKSFDEFKANLNTSTAYYLDMFEKIPSLVTSRMARNNRLMTTYKFSGEKISTESDYFR